MRFLQISCFKTNIWYQSKLSSHRRFHRPTKMASVSQQTKENGEMSILYPMLTLDNYTVWAIKAEAILNAQRVWDAIEPARGAEEKDKKACA